MYIFSRNTVYGAQGTGGGGEGRQMVQILQFYFQIHVLKVILVYIILQKMNTILF